MASEGTLAGESGSDPRDAVRERMHAMWAAVADGWAENADYVESRSAPITDALLELAHLAPGKRVLELACGPGSVGIAAAGRVGPDGLVVLSDVAAEMVEVAAARAQAHGLANVQTRVLDLEAIAEPDASYDAVLCREGLMFASDHSRGARELCRVLRPGGRLAIAVWGPRERNPWLGLLLDAVSAHVGAPVPPPGVPGPFSLADPGELEALLSGAGLDQVEVAELAVSARTSSFGEWWERTSALAGPISQILAALPQDGVAAIRARAEDSAAPYRHGEGLEFPGVTLIAGGTRP